MTVTITLPKNVEQAYVTAARTKGISVDTLVADLLISHVPAPEVTSDPSDSIRRKPDLSPAQRAAAFRAWAERHPLTAPVLSDEAISRETIYSDRG